MDTRAKKALFMGIISRIKGFHLLCSKMKKVIFSRDITFDESPMMEKLTNKAVQTSYTLQKGKSTSKKMEFEKMMMNTTEEANV